MTSTAQGTTVLIPERLTQELIKQPKRFARIFFPLMIAWTVIVPLVILTGAFSVTKNPLVILALILPFYPEGGRESPVTFGAGMNRRQVANTLF